MTGGITKVDPDGYVKNVRVHNGGSINTGSELYYMDPYQSRSVKFRDAFYDSHNHDHKLAVRNNVVTFADGIYFFKSIIVAALVNYFCYFFTTRQSLCGENISLN